MPRTKTKPILLRIPEELLNELDVAASLFRISRNDVVRRLLTSGDIQARLFEYEQQEATFFQQLRIRNSNKRFQSFRAFNRDRNMARINKEIERSEITNEQPIPRKPTNKKKIAAGSRN